MGVTQAFIRYNNPKGNADTERMMRTLKDELLWLPEWRSASELQDRLAQWIPAFNRSCLHSSLGWRTPQQTRQDSFNNPPTTLLSAA